MLSPRIRAGRPLGRLLAPRWPALVAVFICVAASTTGATAFTLHNSKLLTAPGFNPVTADATNRTIGWTNVSAVMSDDDVDPGPTAFSGSAFDPVESGAVFFGGQGPGNVVLNGTWIFMAGEDEWLGVGTHAGLGNASGPPPLLHAGEAYDPVDGYLLMYGGTLSNGSAYGGGWAFGGNTWANLSWTDLGPTMIGSPGPVAWPMMTYDSVDGAVFLYTGAAHGSTWEYRHGAWQQLAVNVNPTPRTGGALVFDQALEEVLLFGGMSVGASPTPLNDTWTFAQGNWTEVASPVHPPAFPSVGMAYDEASASAVLVGGGSALQTWTFSNGLWSNVTASGPSLPEGRVGFSVAYQPLDGWVMLFGGVTWGSSPAVINDDVWGWDFPPQASFTGLLASPLTTDTWIAIVLVAALPIVGAILWARRPRRPTPSDVPASASSARSEPIGAGNG